MYNNQWKTMTTRKLVAELDRLKQEALREADRYRDDERSGCYSNEMLAERRQEMAEGGMIYNQLKQLIAERYATEFGQTQTSSPAPAMTQDEIAAVLHTARQHIDARDYHLAIGEFNRILAADPNNAKTYYQRGLALSQVELYKHALADFKRALYIQPDMPEAFKEHARIARLLR